MSQDSSKEAVPHPRPPRDPLHVIPSPSIQVEVEVVVVVVIA